MFDCHFDLLMYVLLYYQKNNIEELKKYCKGIFREDNITGGIFNLFYNSFDNMKKDFHAKSTESINPINDLKRVKEIIQECSLIPENVNYIIGIEGLDYLKNINDIEELHRLGLRSTNIVWNNPNKFGGGAKASEDMGVTSLGKELIEKVVKTNIAIDLSHANEKTFWRDHRRGEKIKRLRV